MKMRTGLWVAVLLLALCGQAQAALFTFPNTLNQPIPDAGSLVSQQVVSGLPSQITDIDVHLNVSGGFNGQLYAYLLLEHGDTPVFKAVLVNRVGLTGASPVGYDNSGFNIVLDNQAGSGRDIHLYQTVTGGVSPPVGSSWEPDGRDISPASSGAQFDSATRDATLSGFNNADPNGTWTLFFSDGTSGFQSSLISWQLDINAVPEPVNVALGLFGIAAAVAAVGRRVCRRAHS